MCVCRVCVCVCRVCACRVYVVCVCVCVCMRTQEGEKELDVLRTADASYKVEVILCLFTHGWYSEKISPWLLGIGGRGKRMQQSRKHRHTQTLIKQTFNIFLNWILKVKNLWSLEINLIDLQFKSHEIYNQFIVVFLRNCNFNVSVCNVVWSSAKLCFSKVHAKSE